MARNKNTDAASALLNSVTADMLGGYDTDSLAQDNSLRVERILLDLVRPNPLQARRVLPDRVYQDSPLNIFRNKILNIFHQKIDNEIDLQ